MAYYFITNEQLTYLKNKDQKLKKLIDKYGIIKREVETDLFKALVYNIISQQISTKAALTVKNRLIDLLKDVNVNAILNVDEEALKSIGLSCRKVGYLKEIAKRVNNKELDLENLKSLSDDEVIKELTKLPGIGVWTAEMLLLFTLGRENVMSYLDLAIIRGLKRFYNLEEISKEKFNKIKKAILLMQA